MNFDASLIRATVLATQIRVTAEVARAGGNVSQVRILAETAYAAITAAVNAPVIALGVQAQLIKAAALTGQFLKIALFDDAFALSDQATFRMSRALEDLTAIADTVTVNLGKLEADQFAVIDQALVTLNKGLTDTLGLHDAQVISFGKNMVEPVGLSDPMAFRLSTARTDAFGAGEGGPGHSDYALDYVVDDYAYDNGPMITLTKGKSDAAALTDANTKLVNKGLQEPLTLTETISMYMRRTLTDSVGVTDDLDGALTTEDDQTMKLMKGFSETTVIGDTFARVVYFTRNPNDPVALVDQIIRRFTKALTDQAALADAATIRSSKPLADAAAVTDTKAINTGKTAADAAALSDAMQRLTNKGLTEAPAFTDALISRFSKSLADAGAITDAKGFSLTKPFADAGAMTDTTSVSFRPSKTDTTSFTDSGSICSQNYAGAYFAADFVGTKTIF
jgi:hypothetical protein